jgi:hypothetical protein
VGGAVSEDHQDHVIAKAGDDGERRNGAAAQAAEQEQCVGREAHEKKREALQPLAEIGKAMIASKFVLNPPRNRTGEGGWRPKPESRLSRVRAHCLDQGRRHCDLR